MCSCLDAPDGRLRSTRNRLLKLTFFLLFLVASSQFFALFYHFIRLICYLFLDPQLYPPKPLPRRLSLFGVELLQFDAVYSNDNTTLLYVGQAVLASVAAILFGTLGTRAICSEDRRRIGFIGMILALVGFFTAFGSLTFPGMTPSRQIVLPITGTAVAAVLLFTFARLFPPKEPNYRYYV